MSLARRGQWLLVVRDEYSAHQIISPSLLLSMVHSLGQRIAQRNTLVRAGILEAAPSIPTFMDVAGVLAVAGRAEGTSATYGREFARLAKFAAAFSLPAIKDSADVSSFLGTEASVIKYIGFLANKGFAYKTAHKILFSLRASTVFPGVPAPPPFTRFTNLVMKGYESVFRPVPARPVISVAMYHFCSRASLDDLLRSDSSMFSVRHGDDQTILRLARWRAMAALAFFGALRRSEYLGSALLSPCVSFDKTSMVALKTLATQQFSSMRTLWDAVVAALHPRAIVSVNIVVSKCNPCPEKRFIERDAGDPSVCPVAALALWVVLLGSEVSERTPFFAIRDAALVMRGPSAAEVIAPLHHYLAASSLLSPEDIIRVNLHSFRHGGASSAILGGASREQSKCLGRWRGNSDAIYTATTKDRQGLAAASAISHALAQFSAAE